MERTAELDLDPDVVCHDLWRDSGPRLQRLARHLLGQDADDGLQEAFRQIHRGLRGFRGDAALSTWAYRVAILSLLGYRRRRDRRRRRERTTQTPVEALDAATLARFEDDPFRALERSELRARVRAVVAALPEHLRVALVLRSFEGLRYAEIGELLDIPLGTVKSRIAAASVRLAQALRKDMEVES